MTLTLPWLTKKINQEKDTRSNSRSRATLGYRGRVSVEVDQLRLRVRWLVVRFIFRIEKKQWTLDQFGRLALSGGEEGYKPSEEDVVEFQKQLDGALRGKGF